MKSLIMSRLPGNSYRFREGSESLIKYFLCSVISVIWLKNALKTPFPGIMQVVEFFKKFLIRGI